MGAAARAARWHLQARTRHRQSFFFCFILILVAMLDYDYYPRKSPHAHHGAACFKKWNDQRVPDFLVQAFACICPSPQGSAKIFYLKPDTLGRVLTFSAIMVW
jgi:hypothetical protein